MIEDKNEYSLQTYNEIKKLPYSVTLTNILCTIYEEFLIEDDMISLMYCTDKESSSIRNYFYNIEEVSDQLYFTYFTLCYFDTYFMHNIEYISCIKHVTK